MWKIVLCCILLSESSGIFLVSMKIFEERIYFLKILSLENDSKLMVKEIDFSKLVLDLYLFCVEDG